MIIPHEELGDHKTLPFSLVWSVFALCKVYFETQTSVHADMPISHFSSDENVLQGNI